MADDRRPVLSDLFPQFAGEIAAALLADEKEADLADQLPTLEVWGRCTCDDEVCASFYTGPRSGGAWSDDGEHQNVVLSVSRGMVVLDVVDRVIRYVEVLDRPDIKRLVAPLPPLEPRLQ